MTPAPGRARGLALRVLCVLICATSGAALMAKVYGVAEMRTVVLWTCLPGAVVLLIVVRGLRHRDPLLATDLFIGAVGGLIGTVGYDVVRIPAHVAGYRVYGTISVFGLWLLDADRSSRVTELAGWSFNYLNGICFGMMYAVFMRGRHWLWGVVWALVLETIAVVTPFGQMFGIRGNWPVLGIAYAAHIAYGVPLGRAVQGWRDTRLALQEMPRPVRWTLVILAVAVLFHPFLSPGAAAADRRARAGQFRVEGLSLNPGWLRVRAGESVVIFNPQDAAVAVTIKDLGQTLSVPPGASIKSPPLPAGLHQFFVVTSGRTQSSFVATEPMEQSR